MMAVPDTASIAASHWLENRLGRRFGPSTGTNMVGVLALAVDMRSRGHSGSIATIACDSGDRYGDTIYDSEWLNAHNIHVNTWKENLDDLRSEKHGFSQKLQRCDFDHSSLKREGT
jgi:cysteine synthase A